MLYIANCLRCFRWFGFWMCWSSTVSLATAAPSTSQSTTRGTESKDIALPTLWRSGGKTLKIVEILGTLEKNNPTLKQLRRVVQIYRQKEKQVGVWPDLQVGIEGSNFPLPSFDPTQTAMSGIQYSISQQFPILRRLGLEREAAKFVTQMGQEDIREKRAWLRYEVRQALYWLSFYRDAMETERQLFALTGQVAQVARTRYAVGKGSQQNYLQAWTIQAQIRNQMVSIQSLDRRMRYRLDMLVGKVGVSRGKAPVLVMSVSPSSWQDLYKQALLERGSMRRWRLAAQQAKTLLSLARVRYWPDVMVNVGIRQRFPNPHDSGVPFLSVGIKISLPTWGNPARYALVQEAMVRHQWAASRLQEESTQVQEKIRSVFAELQQYDRQIRVYRDQILPLALQTYRSSLSQYQVDRGDFVALLAYLQTLYKEKLQLQRLQVQRAVAIAQLMALSGRL